MRRSGGNSRWCWLDVCGPGPAGAGSGYPVLWPGSCASGCTAAGGLGYRRQPARMAGVSVEVRFSSPCRQYRADGGATACRARPPGEPGGAVPRLARQTGPGRLRRRGGVLCGGGGGPAGGPGPVQQHGDRGRDQGGATAIRVICQPGMPPAGTTRLRAPGAGLSGWGSSSPPQAAGMTAAEASRVQVTAARAAASRRSRAAACRAAVRG